MAVSGERETIDREMGKPVMNEKRSRGNLKTSYMKFLLRVKDRPMKVTVQVSSLLFLSRVASSVPLPALLFGGTVAALVRRAPNLMTSAADAPIDSAAAHVRAAVNSDRRRRRSGARRMAVSVTKRDEAESLRRRTTLRLPDKVRHGCGPAPSLR